MVPCIRVHMVGDWDNGNCLLHSSFCLDNGSCSRQLEDLSWNVYELLLASMSSDYSRYPLFETLTMSLMVQPLYVFLGLAWTLRDWHWHLRCISALVAVGSVILYWLPESPRWLVAR